MNRVIEFLESHGFVSELDAERVERMSAREGHKLYEEMYRLADAEQTANLGVDSGPFSFMASASLRGETCFHCRLDKLSALAHYAALYCDKVLLPLPLSSPSKLRGFGEGRILLARAISSILAIRPVIEDGVVEPLVMTTHHCEHEQQWVNPMMSMVRDTVNHLQRDVEKASKVVYQRPDKAPGGVPTVYVDGPEEFFDHGLVGVYRKQPPWLAKSWRYDKFGKVIVPLPRRKHIGVINWLFDRIASDTTFYLAYARFRHTRYLSDLPGEALLLDWMSADEELLEKNRLVRELLSHAVPLGTDFPLRTILKVRRNEPEPFLRYRAAINRITDDLLRRGAKPTRKEIREIGAELVNVEVAELNRAIRQGRLARAKQAAIGALGLLANVLVGAFALPLPLPVQVAAAGASAMLVGNSIKDSVSSDPRKNDFYFLLRLRQEAGKR